MKEEYKDNLEFKENIDIKLKFEIKVYAYTNTRESAVNGKWQHSDPVRQWFNLEDIYQFREQTLYDKYNNDCISIMDSTVMPTKWCMMVYHDKYEKTQKVIPVVGDYKEMNKLLESLRDKYYKGNNRLDRLNNKIKDLYLFEECDI